MSKHNKRNRQNYSNHHKLPKNKGGTNHPDNIDRIRVVEHRAIHTLFADGDVNDKVRRILEDDRAVLQGDFIRDIQRVLALYKWLEYHSHIKKK